MKINDYITKETIFFLNSTDKHGVLNELINSSKILDEQKRIQFKRAIDERESLLSTGIGLGVAIPHATIPDCKDFIILTGLLKSPVEWESIDKAPVSIVFLIGVPPNSHTQYLKLLSQLMLIVKNNEKRECLLNADNDDKLIQCFNDQF